MDKIIQNLQGTEFIGIEQPELQKSYTPPKAIRPSIDEGQRSLTPPKAVKPNSNSQVQGK